MCTFINVVISIKWLNLTVEILGVLNASPILSVPVHFHMRAFS